MKIDNKIHFIWVGKVIPKKYAIGILEHLDLNYKHYTVTLWTDKPKENRDLFASTLTDKRFRIRNGTVKNVTKEEIQGRLTLGFDDAVDREGSTRKTLSFINISVLNAECGALKARYKDALAVRNFGRASDVLRLVILRKEGGIYMDTDVESKTSLPPSIDAKDGFLMGYGQAGRQVFTNAVMAASTKSDFVPELIKSIQFTFEFFDAKNWWEVNHRNTLATRADLNTAKDRKTATKSELDILREKYYNAMIYGTLPVTGPIKVELFLYKRMLDRKAVDPLGWLADQLGNEMLKNPSQFNEAMKQFLSTIARPQMEKGRVIAKYSFPMDYIIIRSDASWM